jgi:phosphopantetheinyl transferase
MEPWIEIERLPHEASGLARRVAERAAWRAIVSRRLGNGVAVGYNKNGAPVLLEPPGSGFISVSHTRGWVAVIWSPEPCAIDIELRGRELSAAAAARYSISSPEDWCALEVAYKYRGLTDREPAPGSVSFPPHPELIVAVISHRYIEPNHP